MADGTLPSLPWKTRLRLAALDATHYLVRRRDGSVNRRLMSLLDYHAPANPVPVDGISTSDHSVDPARGLWVRLFSPADAAAPPARLPVIIYFHGGGFAFYSVATRFYDPLCRWIARMVPATVVSVEYRLAPEHRFPAAYDDGSDALRWVVGGAGGLLPGSPAVFLAGDSAGGNIAHHVACRAAAAERGRIAGVVLLQPFFGGEGRTESEARFSDGPVLTVELSDWFWRAFLPVGADRDHEAANVFGSGSGRDVAGFPDTAVFVSGCDPLRDWQMEYVKGLRAAGVEVRLVDYPRAIHAFHLFEELPESEQVISDLRDFVQAQLGKRQAGSTA